MMDAGVPIVDPVAGISIGMISSGDKYELLTDILGDEDHFGHMDFKVAGTKNGITAIQLDIKAEGLDHAIMVETLERAKVARLSILDIFSTFAPTRFLMMRSETCSISAERDFKYGSGMLLNMDFAWVVAFFSAHSAFTSSFFIISMVFPYSILSL